MIVSLNVLYLLDGNACDVDMLWDKEFQSQEHIFHTSTLTSVREGSVHELQPPSAPPTDEMARLAAQVVEAVEHEQNPKFKESAFMGLMRQLRDGDVVLDQNGFVASDAPSTSIDVKGKGKARASTTLTTGGTTTLSSSTQEREQDANEAYFQQENNEFTAWWEAHHAGALPTVAPTGPSSTTAGPSTMSLLQQKQREIGQWYEMQDAWDEFEATTTGVQPVLEYKFQKENPYLREGAEMGRTMNHTMHMGGVERIYEVCGLLSRFLSPLTSLPEHPRARSSSPTGPIQCTHVVRAWRPTAVERTRGQSHTGFASLSCHRPVIPSRMARTWGVIRE